MSSEDATPELADERRSTLLGEDVEELYEDAPCGYLSTAMDGTILRANRTFLQLGRYAADEIVGRKRLYDLLPPGAKIYYETHYAPLLQMQQSVQELALEIVRSDGLRVPVLVNATLKRDEAGDPAVVRITVLDASHRREYERELMRARAAAEARAAAAGALEHVTEGVVLLDDDGRVVVLNPAAVRMFDLRAKDELTGESFAALVPGWNAVASRIPVGRGGEAVPPAVVPLPGEGGASWIAASGQDAADGIVYTLRDVTEERRLEDMRDDIVAIVSHELRTPLTGVLGAAQTLVARGSELGEKLRADLALMIVEQSGRLARIVEEILLTRQLDSGELSFERGSFDVGERVSKVVAEAGTWRTSRLVDLDVAGAVHADADPSLFEQVLVNVLDNAFKYSPADQSIEIRVEPHRSNARVVVTDRGPGVAAVHHEAVFQKFLRLDPEHSSGVTGTGLGLYIARELARRMHGQVGILPSKIGAAFFIDLPLAHDDGVGSIPGA